ncbi:hypothetical protein HUJ05_001053 [Dendroctonus ponderosae]|nr:hypothetical protein HUJ05_001053 [Dendroctonus ponderosae]KAH1027573.1 hypothetical protein HUJ05_001053 [Dendroctonus ponderosae]
MKITTNRYTAILTLQTFLLTIDWIMNIVGLVATQTNASMVTLLIVQDACILVALSTLLLTFFSTYLFKNGLVYLLYERFRTSLVICMFYFILTTVLHVWSIATKWSTSRYSWTTGYVVLLVLQRLKSVTNDFTKIWTQAPPTRLLMYADK